MGNCADRSIGARRTRAFVRGVIPPFFQTILRYIFKWVGIARIVADSVDLNGAWRDQDERQPFFHATSAWEKRENFPFD